MEGRALAGFATGGKCFGFSTVVESNPPDPMHPRKVPVIDPSEAEVVLRVFRLFDDGTALKPIAAILNRDGIAAPMTEDAGTRGLLGGATPPSERCS